MAASQRVGGTAHWDKYARGTPDDLSDEQAELVEQYLVKAPTEEVESVRFPEEPPKYFACRILRASRYDIVEALRRTNETSKWRSNLNVDQLRQQDPVTVLGCAEDELFYFYPKAYFPAGDKQNRPVYVERGGIADAEALFAITDDDKLVAYHTYANETEMRDLFTRNSREAGRPITDLLAIIDMGGMTMKLANSTTVRYIKAMVGIDSKHYPETLAKMLIINVPSFFSLCWKLITPFLDERTQRKIEIISNPSAWQARLRELVDPAKLPVEYGGQLQVPGGLFPPSRTVKTHLTAGQVIREVVPLSPGQTVQFKWFVRPGDIRFSVHLGSGAPPARLEDVSTPLPSGLQDVYKDRAHPGSDTHPVIFQYTCPGAASSAAAGGSSPSGAGTSEAADAGRTSGAAVAYLVAIYSNKEGWRARDLFHRMDTLVDGKPVRLTRS